MCFLSALLGGAHFLYVNGYFKIRGKQGLKNLTSIES